MVTGAGTKFDKDNGNDNLSYSYFNAKGDVTITAKMKVSGSGKAQAGVLVRKSDQIWQAWRKEWSKSFRKC